MSADIKANKPFRAGSSSFNLLRQESGCYIDKTRFIKTIMESGCAAEAILRPRNFGKTLFLDTLRAFLSINPEAPDDISRHEELFHGLDIAKDSIFCEQYMGKVPVLCFSFGGIEGADFEGACRDLAYRIAEYVSHHSYLFSSSQLNEHDKKALQNYRSLPSMRMPELQSFAASFFSDLVSFIARHFGRPAVLLIDDYDWPLSRASADGFCGEMSSLIRSMLEILKPEDAPRIGGLPVLDKAVLTGCLPMRNESLTTGLNNLVYNTVCTDDRTLAASMGFTESEVNALLSDCGLVSRKDDVRHWYGGYRFGQKEIYCPGDVINFCKSALRSEDALSYRPVTYWSETSFNKRIDAFLENLSEADAERLQRLLDGKEIELKINEQLSWADTRNHPLEDFWSLLLFTGYLTASEYLGGQMYRLRIPNEEIRTSIKARAEIRFSWRNAAFAQLGTRLAEAALAGDPDGMADVLEPLLRSYVSVDGAASQQEPAERYCLGFLSALLTAAEGQIRDLCSSAETDSRHADIAFSSGTGSRRTGVVIAVKHAEHAEDLRQFASEALKAIESGEHDFRYTQLRSRRCLAYGIAFSGSWCEVKGGFLKDLP